MTKQNAPKCPTCGSTDPDYSPDGDENCCCYCDDDWHHEHAAPPEGETMIDHGFAAHTSGVKCSLCDWLKQQEAIASPGMSADLHPSKDDSDWKRIFLQCLAKYPWMHAGFNSVMLAPIADAMEAYADLRAAALTAEQVGCLTRERDAYLLQIQLSNDATRKERAEAEAEVVQLREQEIELRKSLESARRDIARRNNLIVELRARAALESTTPQEK